MPVPNFCDIDDVVVWCLDLSGRYSIRSIYHWLLKPNFDFLPHYGWNWVQKLKLPEKIRFLLWLVSHDALPTNSSCFARHLYGTNLWSQSMEFEESILYYLHDYIKPHQIWNSLGFHCFQSFFFADLYAWFHDSCLHDEGIVFMLVVWWIWRVHSTSFISGKSWESSIILRNISSMCVDINSVFGRIVVSSKRLLLVRWD